MYRVVFDFTVYQKLRLYAQKCDEEISGLGRVEKDDFNEILHVHEIFLLKQANGISSTVISQEAIAKFMDEILQKNESPADYKCWWHSHADMGVEWSAIDDTTINDFDLETKENNWWLSVLTNREERIVCRLDVFSPLRLTLNLPWKTEIENSQLAQSVEKEIKQNVRKTKVSKMPSFAGKEWDYNKGKWVDIKKQQKKRKKKKKHQKFNSINFHRGGYRNNYDIPKLGGGSKCPINTRDRRTSLPPGN